VSLWRLLVLASPGRQGQGITLLRANVPLLSCSRTFFPPPPERQGGAAFNFLGWPGARSPLQLGTFYLSAIACITFVSSPGFVCLVALGLVLFFSFESFPTNSISFLRMRSRSVPQSLEVLGVAVLLAFCTLESLTFFPDHVIDIFAPRR